MLKERLQVLTMEILKKKALCLTLVLNDAGSLLGKPSEMKKCRFLSSGKGSALSVPRVELMFPCNSESCLSSAVLKHTPLSEHLPAD